MAELLKFRDLCNVVDNKGIAEEQMGVVMEYAKTKRHISVDGILCGNCGQHLTEAQMTCPVCKTQFALPDMEEAGFIEIQMALLDVQIRYPDKSLEEAAEAPDYMDISAYEGVREPNRISIKEVLKDSFPIIMALMILTLICAKLTGII